MLVFLAFVSLLLFASAEEQDTLLCFGDGFKKTIGGSKTVTDIDLSCPSCLQSELCITEADSEVCMRLSEDKIHFFSENGAVLQDPLSLSGCMPLRIQNADRRGFVVICASIPTEYQPTRQYFSCNFDHGMFALHGSVLTQRTGMEYAPQLNNYALVNEHFSEYIISSKSGSNKIVIEHGSASYEKTVTGCSNIHQVIAGPLYEGYIQVVVTCESTDGDNAGTRVSILEHELDSDPIIDSLYAPLPNDIIWFEGEYIVYWGSTRLVFIRTSNIAGDPGIFQVENRPIDNVAFLSDDLVLISVDGQPHETLDVPTYFTTSFEHGRTILTNSKAYCPGGRCAPHRVSEGKLYLFNKDSSSYLYLVSYDLSDLSAEPTQIRRSVIEDEFNVCFKTTADLPVTETDPPSSPPPSKTTTPETLPPATVTGAGIRPSQKPPFPLPAIAGIVAAIFLTLVIIGAAVLGYFLCKSSSFRKRAKLLCKQQHSQDISQRHTQDTERGCGSLHVYLTSTLGCGQAPPTSGGSHGSSSTPSSAPSLTKLNTSTEPQVSTDKPVHVTAHQESVQKHADIRPGVATTTLVS